MRSELVTWDGEVGDGESAGGEPRSPAGVPNRKRSTIAPAHAGPDRMGSPCRVAPVPGAQQEAAKSPTCIAEKRRRSVWYFCFFCPPSMLEREDYASLGLQILNPSPEQIYICWWTILFVYLAQHNFSWPMDKRMHTRRGPGNSCMWGVGGRS